MPSINTLAADSIRPEHHALIVKACDLIGFASIEEYPESALGALIIADEIRRSTAKICQALKELNETQKDIRDKIEISL
jgi:hypothetical protein